MGFMNWLKGISNDDKLIEYSKDSNNDKIEKYLNKGANPNRLDKEGFAPLHYTTNVGNLTGTRYLLNNGAQLFLPSQKGGTPMDLITEKLYVNHIYEPLDKDGNTSLMYCAMCGDKKNIEKLMHYESDYTKQNRFGHTAFMIALMKDHKRTALAIRKNMSSHIKVKIPHTVMRDVQVEKQRT